MKHKKYLSRIILFILIFISVFILKRIKRISKDKEAIEQTVTKISFEGINFLSKDPFNNSNTILALFHPSCDFCQADTEMVKEEIKRFEDIDLIWVSYDDKDAIAQFSKTYGLDSLENVHFAYMDIEVMLERYGNVKFPTFLAYKNGALLQKFVGVTKPEVLLSVYASEK